MSIRVNAIHVINIDDICDEFNTSGRDYKFLEGAENGSYTFLNTDEDALEEARNELDAAMERCAQSESKIWESKKLYEAEVMYDLINYLHYAGYKDGVLVYTAW